MTGSAVGRDRQASTAAVSHYRNMFAFRVGARSGSAVSRVNVGDAGVYAGQIGPIRSSTVG
jgi:hypothetical protein